MSSLDENEADDEIYNDFNLPFHIIDEAADLSQLRHGGPRRSFGEIFAQERPLQQRNDGDSLPLDSDSILISETNLTYACTATSPQLLEQWLNTGPSPDTALEQQTGAEGRGHESLVKEAAAPPPATPAPRSTKRSANKNGRLRVSDKKDLAPAHIAVVAHNLISAESILYFLNNSQFLCEGWIPLPVHPPLGCNNSIEHSVIAAFDRVRDLSTSKNIGRLMLRFAYIHLRRVIDTYRAVAANERIKRQVGRKVGQSDASIAIDMYLEAKRGCSGETLKRSKLSDQYRAGKRYSVLAALSAISLYVFSPVAETLV